MSVTKPHRRTCRQFADGKYDEGGRWQYIKHPKYAADPTHYIRAFQLIQKYLLELFDYVEPSDRNLDFYSYRIHELHTRTCIEIEANCKAILTENNYSRTGDWNMGDYKKRENTHRLSKYSIKMPLWHGTQEIPTPFPPWDTGGALPWYQAYNQAKHDRHQQFAQANFRNLLGSVTALIAMISSQFHTQEFSRNAYVIWSGRRGGWELDRGYFLLEFPGDWPAQDRYDFDWAQLANDPDPLQSLTF